MEPLFWNYAREYVPLIDREIFALLPKEPARVYGPIRELIQSGGKRVRSVLCLLTCQALTGSSSIAMKHAVILELLHNFTLIHDDIEDFSQQRRSKPTLHAKYGVPLAINYGDVLFAIVNKNASQLESVAREMINDDMVATGEGQAFDLLFRESWDFDTASYISMVEKKTGALTGSACALGAIAAGKKEYVDALHMYGIETGTAFQIQDDVLNLIGNEKLYGKEIGGDIVEKKKTLMVAYLLEKASKQDKEAFMQLWKKEQMDADTIKSIIELMKKYGAIDYATSVAKSLTDSAKKRLENIQFKDQKAADALKSFADFVVNRSF